MKNNLQKALAAHQSGNLAEAEKLYRDVLAAEPDQADALALLGVALDAKGDHAEAVTLIEKAIRLDPDTPLFRLHLGNALTMMQRFGEAAAAFRRAIELQPNLPQAHFNLGNVLCKMKEWDAAIAAYRLAVGYNPDYAEAHNNLALALVHKNKFDEAMQEARRSVTVAPNYGEAWLTFCNVAEQVKDYEAARMAGERVVRLLPEDHRAWFGYGVALNRTARHEEAIGIYKRALALKPERADIWDNLGQTYQSLNRLEEAEAIYRKTVEVAGQTIGAEEIREVAEEEYGNRHWHLALIELLRGKYKQGFARYRARFKDVGELKRPDLPQPLWRGENLNGKTILITDEQGYGDTLMFCRYLPMLKAQGARVIFSVHPVLEPLFRGWSGADRIVVHGEKFSGFDFYAATFDLPHRFGTTLETVPANVPYLPLLEPDTNAELEIDSASSAERIPSPLRGGLGWGDHSKDDAENSYRSPRGTPPHLTSPASGEELLKIAVIWGGSPLHKNDENRSVPLKIFSELFAAPGTQFYSLNRDMKPGDAELLPRLPVINLAPRVKNFADAARFMRQCDLVITCDTASAHLAGGLGLPVWILLPFAPDWRWLTDRAGSPWYPEARLFRQTKTGEWENVIARVKEALGNKTGLKN